ncbi:phytoene synthase [Galdieria sulphuraria]|uniref:15-cis-phytoene synthase n=1 Tax=Galdieria sulphuraria TaxID=130081 RepID=M2Y038_GALSU|nr:phytoene synthase [Galdieria sulphuraria]EME29253.1 phytoene synthase [Galdieria sulphuraria]|eukprot:XP_005705773.1 phytoene synthase [Galdieria sulphuraria]
MSQPEYDRSAYCFMSCNTTTIKCLATITCKVRSLYTCKCCTTMWYGGNPTIKHNKWLYLLQTTCWYLYVKRNGTYRRSCSCASTQDEKREQASVSLFVDKPNADSSPRKTSIQQDIREWTSVNDPTSVSAQDISFYERQRVFQRRKRKLLRDSFAECGRITSHFAKTFYIGTLFMQPQKQEAVWAIYVWCRRTDDLVDGPRASQRKNQLESILGEWKNRLETVFSGRPYDVLDLALYESKLRFPRLRMEPFYEMINGMQMDVERDRYDTFEELYLYCYRVAGTVGIMTLAVMGVADPNPETYYAAEEAAVCLGIAFQLTNILRDVGEDCLRGRIYIPREDLIRFDYSEHDMMAGIVDERYKNLMRFEMERARQYFSKAENGISLLSPDVRLPVRASLDMYRRILDVIEENGYDNFHRRAYVGKWKKLSMLPMSWILCQEGIFWNSCKALFRSS